MKIGSVGEKNEFGEYHGGYGTEYGKYVSKLTKCPFCEKDETEILAQTKLAYVTISNFPRSTYELLVNPKRHITSLLDITSEEMMEIQKLIKKTVFILKKLGEDNISILVREGILGKGKTINHTHYIISNAPSKLINQRSDKREQITKQEIKEIKTRLEKYY